MGIFNWIRRQVRDSFLLGFQDALEEVGAEPEQGPPRLDRLRALAAAEAKALPAAKDDDDAPKRKKGG